MALSTFTPTVDEIVQSDAPRASVNPVGAEPYLLMLPSADVAAFVPVPLVVPPADSMVRLIELSTVPVTVSVPELVAADAIVAVIIRTAATAKVSFFTVFIAPSLYESRRGT